MGKKFDLSEFMSPGDIVSESDTAAGRQVVMIPVGSIRPNEKNFYAVDDVSGLIDSILIHGVLDPATVRRDGEGYVLISGHRRYSAVKKILDEKLCSDPSRFEHMPCFVVEPKDELLEELMLIQANSSTRVLTASEVSRQAERVEDILYRLKEQGYDFPGRMRDHVAEACRVSAAKLARLKVIRGGLCSEYMKRFDADELSEQAAYSLARLPTDLQRRLFKIDSAPSGFAVERIAKKYSEDGWRWEPEQTCPDGTACKRGDAFLRHDLNCLVYEQCGGKKCCLNCDKGNSAYSPCERACSKLQAMRKEARDTEKLDAERARLEKQTAIQKLIRCSCERIARAADAAGLDDKTELAVSPYAVYTAGDIRRFAKGDFGDKYFYSNAFESESISNFPKLCKTLRCSADYLAGFTDELREAQSSDLAELTEKEDSMPPLEPLDIRQGPPPKTGWYAARFDCKGCTMRKLVWYDVCLGKFYFDKSHGHFIEAECSGWIALPEDF